MSKVGFLWTVVLSLTPVSSRVLADVHAAVAIDDGGVREFHVAVCEHYHVKQDAIVVVRKQNIPDDHIPVVFFLAHHAKVSHDEIVALRLRGMSWMAISLHFGLPVDIFHVEVTRVHGPPYGNAFGHFKNRKRAEWASIRLQDDEVVTLVNVKFLSARYHMSPDDVIGMRQKAKGFIGLHGDLKLHQGQGNGEGKNGEHDPNAQPDKEHGAQEPKGPHGPEAVHGPAGGPGRGGGGGVGKGRK